MKKIILLILIFLLSVLSVFFLLSCANVTYHTYYEGGFDPFYDFKNLKTIGFTPFGWTNTAREIGYDELFEKQLYVLAKKELEKKGFEVFYISPEYLEYNTTTNVLSIKTSYKEMPDLTLTVFYYQGLGNVVEVPGTASGLLKWGKSLGIGSFNQTQSYKVQTYFLALAYTLWSGPPKYINKAWEGVIKKGSPILDLQDQAKRMTVNVFKVKFEGREAPWWH